MADDKTKKGTPDKDTISLSEAWEVTYWCKKFGCTERQLRAAVAAVGKSAVKVGVYLKSKK